jgi:hypothetical protein
MERSEIQLWLRNPVTQWFFNCLQEEVWVRPEQWATVQAWEEAVALRERERLRARVNSLLGSPRSDPGLLADSSQQVVER